MKTLLYIFNTLMVIIIVSITTAQAGIMTAENELKVERYAVLGAWFLFGVSMLITYLIWKKNSNPIIHQTHKIRTRTYEIIDHGKRVVITKKLPDSKHSTKRVA